MQVDIKGLPWKPIVNGVDFSSLPTKTHKKIIRNLAPHNYHQIEDYMVVGFGTSGNTLILRKTNKYGREEEKEVIDCQAMYAVNNFGYGKIFHEILETVFGSMWQIMPPASPRAMDHNLHAPLLEALDAYTGKHDYLFLLKSGGTEATSTALNTTLKFFFIKNGRSESVKPVIIATGGNFHGRSRDGRMLSTSSHAREGFFVTQGNIDIIHVPFGKLEALEDVFTNKKYEGRIALFLTEPIQGEAGVIIPPDEYLPEAFELCRAHDVLFGLDEIQTGFGRTGTNFVYERYGIVPDLLCMGKALGAGVIPVSCVAGKREIMETIEEGTEGATWSATPIQCMAALAAVRASSTYALSEQSNERGKILHEKLLRLRAKYPHAITDVRCKGLFAAVDIPFDGKKISQALLDLPSGEAVWAKETGGGKSIRISPPLTITPEEIIRVVRSFETVIGNFFRKQFDM